MGLHGTSWILRILPFIESDATFKAWDFTHPVASTVTVIAVGGNAAVANMDVKGLYCPSRRTTVRANLDQPMLLNSTWIAGGNDYGGCAGRHTLFNDPNTLNLPDANNHLMTMFQPGVDVVNALYHVVNDVTGQCDSDKGFGVFGNVNVSTSFGAVKDGLSNTFVAGELQRITVAANTVALKSCDGWAAGGPSTLFTTGFPYPLTSRTNPLMNNGYWQSPGSDHPNGANFALGDGSVKFYSNSMDSNVFALMGSMADHVSLTQEP